MTFMLNSWKNMIFWHILSKQDQVKKIKCEWDVKSNDILGWPTTSGTGSMLGITVENVAWI